MQQDWYECRLIAGYKATLNIFTRHSKCIINYDYAGYVVTLLPVPNRSQISNRGEATGQVQLKSVTPHKEVDKAAEPPRYL